MNTSLMQSAQMAGYIYEKVIKTMAGKRRPNSKLHKVPGIYEAYSESKYH
jgi:hypothetical protein